ncbi:unnamed protein product [Parascedosporium putredinis]|uniref:Uncharacterized protein n=1 Tax=Parascedosporium putredinis TaxID=1442378 RepID=A0A9P1HA70_9PEZI|nr:unnamed protein product [Parascedosporium putredinis]CAI8001521.1 unnamed protein product [Parascedosporium putredinis]
MAPTPITPTITQAFHSLSKTTRGARQFTTSRCHSEVSRQRREMFEWLKTLERDVSKNPKGSHYLGGYDQPFPQNPLFRSQPVLDEGARELIWRRSKKNGEPLKVVSADLGVDVRRVAAVVRLKEVEKRWISEGNVSRNLMRKRS